MVYDQVNTLKNWENWSPWHKIDKGMKLTYSGPCIRCKSEIFMGK